MKKLSELMAMTTNESSENNGKSKPILFSEALGAEIALKSLEKEPITREDKEHKSTLTAEIIHII